MSEIIDDPFVSSGTEITDVSENSENKPTGSGGLTSLQINLIYLRLLMYQT